MKEHEVGKLVEVWKVLEALAVSLDRIGSYEIFHGKEAAKQALNEYMGPGMTQRIVRARRLLGDVLEATDPSVGERLDTMAEDSAAIGYWDGPASD